LPLISLPMTGTREEVDRLTDIVKSVAHEFVTGKDISAEMQSSTTPVVNTNTPAVSHTSEILRYGLLIGTPRACIDIEEFLSRDYHNDISFITFHADLLTEFMFGMSPDDFITAACTSPVVHHHHAYVHSARAHEDNFAAAFSPLSATSSIFSPSSSKVTKYYSEVNPFMHVDEVGVGTLLSQTIKSCRQLKKHTNQHLKLGIIGDFMCSDPMSLKFFNTLDINYVGCHPTRTEMTCLGAAQAQIRYSATGSSGLLSPGLLSHSTEHVEHLGDWYNTSENGTYSSSVPPASYFGWHSLREAPFLHMWKKAESESMKEDKGAQPAEEEYFPPMQIF